MRVEKYPHVIIFAVFIFVFCFSWNTYGQNTFTNRYDKVIQTLVEKIHKNPQSPLSFTNIMEIFKVKDFVSSSTIDIAMTSIAGIKNLHPQAKILLNSYKIFNYSSKGNFKEAAEEVLNSGFITRWFIVGPFDNQDLNGQEREMGPEMDMGEPFKMGLSYDGKERSVSWKDAQSDPLSGILDFSRFLYPDEKVCGYAGTYVEVEKKTETILWSSSSGTLSIWVDGVKVINDTIYRKIGPVRHAAVINLQKGVHEILSKVCIDSGDWKLLILTTDKRGNPLPFTHGNVEEIAKNYKKPLMLPKVKTFETVLAYFEKLIQKDKKPENFGNYATYLILSSSDDTKQKKAQEYAKKGAEETHNCIYYLTYAIGTDDPNKASWAIEKCLRIEPTNPDALVLKLYRIRDSVDISEYASMVERFSKSFPDDPHSSFFTAEILEQEGFPILSIEKIKTAVSSFGKIPFLLEKMLFLSDNGATKKESDSIFNEILSIEATNPYLHQITIQKYQKEGEGDKLLEEIKVIRKYFWTDVDLVRSSVNALIGIKDFASAKELLVEETIKNGDNPTVWENLGSFYNLIGETKLAISCYQTVLGLNPQNVKVRQYISKLMPEEKFEVPYIKSDEYLVSITKKLLAEEKKSKPSPWSTDKVDVTILFEQEIDRVYENGTSAKFIQRGLRINSDQGARLQRYQVIGYSPTRQDLKILRASVIHEDGSIEDATQRFTIPVVEEEYRLYYDDANEIVEMPSLKRGDIINFQYKLSDSELKNLWERHFGNIVPLQTVYPKLKFIYQIIADKNINLYTNGGNLKDVSYIDKQEGENRVFRWESENVKPIIPEPAMVPIEEISPSIRVTTFSSWEEIGKWWWSLASPQMVIDKQIKQKVAELIKDKKTEEEKIEAIFDWVIKSTRYVGLEFGIHGFKPYKTTEVMSRGFGDCKDKATLLYVMMKEAGIDAGIALLRTKNSGILSSDFPFQFFFDHAIAVIPSSNLYLDGTVNYLDFKTLPSGDQGVFALVISDGKVEKKITPMAEPEQNTQILSIETNIDNAGNASIKGRVTVTGIIASFYRSMYQTEGTRKERLESELSQIFPGIDIEKFSFSGLDNFKQPVDIEFNAYVPSIATIMKDEIQLTALPSHNLYSRYASRSHRKFPVSIDNLKVLTDRFIYKAPSGTVFSSIPQSREIGNNNGDYYFKFESSLLDSQTLEIKATLKMNVFRIMPENYNEFREFCKKVDETTDQRIHIMKLAP